MTKALREVLDSVRSALHKVLLVAGFICFLISLVFFSRMYQWFSLGSFFFGVLLILIGTILHSGSFTLKFPSIEGWSTILMYTSALFLAFAVIAFLFAVPGSYAIIPAGIRSWSEKLVMINLARPMAWLAPILVYTGIGLFAFGFLLRFIRDIV